MPGDKPDTDVSLGPLWPARIRRSVASRSRHRFARSEGPADHPRVGARRALRPRPAANYGRRRLLAVAVVATVAVIGYFVVHSLSGGGSGGAGDDSYLNANHDIAAQGTSMITAGTDLRTMRNIGVFRVSVEASVAKIGTTVAALNRLAADQTGTRARHHPPDRRQRGAHRAGRHDVRERRHRW